MNQTSSLRRKLISITLVGSVLTALVAAAAFTWWDLSRFWEWTGAEVTALASVVGDQVGPAVVLNDRKAAAEILASLRSDARIREAVLYDNRGVCFAEFYRGTSGNCPLRGVDGIRREAGSILISRPITSGGERVGTVLLTANLPTAAAILQPVSPRSRPDRHPQTADGRHPGCDPAITGGRPDSGHRQGSAADGRDARLRRTRAGRVQ